MSTPPFPPPLPPPVQLPILPPLPFFLGIISSISITGNGGFGSDLLEMNVTSAGDIDHNFLAGTPDPIDPCLFIAMAALATSAYLAKQPVLIIYSAHSGHPDEIKTICIPPSAFEVKVGGNGVDSPTSAGDDQKRPPIQQAKPAYPRFVGKITDVSITGHGAYEYSTLKIGIISSNGKKMSFIAGAQTLIAPHVFIAMSSLATSAYVAGQDVSIIYIPISGQIDMAQISVILIPPSASEKKVARSEDIANH